MPFPCSYLYSSEQNFCANIVCRLSLVSHQRYAENLQDICKPAVRAKISQPSVVKWAPLTTIARFLCYKILRCYTVQSKIVKYCTVVTRINTIFSSTYAESFCARFLWICTVKKAERDTGPKHEGDGKFHHPRRTIRKIRQHQRLGLSIYMGDGIFRHPCVVVLRQAWLF
jgi:hypothetical protein